MQRELEEMQAKSDNMLAVSHVRSQLAISNKTAMHALQGQSITTQSGASDQKCQFLKTTLLFYGHLGKLSNRPDYVQHILAKRKQRRHHNIMKRLAFEHFTRKSDCCNIKPGQETKNLVALLDEYKKIDLRDIEAFMQITRWSEIFSGADNKPLRNTLRAMQKLFISTFQRKIHDPYRIQFGTGDLSEE